MKSMVTPLGQHCAGFLSFSPICYLAVRVRVKPANHSTDLGLGNNNAMRVSDPGVLVGSGPII